MSGKIAELELKDKHYVYYEGGDVGVFNMGYVEVIYDDEERDVNFGFHEDSPMGFNDPIVEKLNEGASIEYFNEETLPYFINDNANELTTNSIIRISNYAVKNGIKLKEI